MKKSWERRPGRDVRRGSNRPFQKEEAADVHKHAFSETETDWPTRICRVRKQWGSPQGQCNVSKARCPFCSQTFFRELRASVREKKVGNRSRVSSEQAKNCFGLHRTHLLIKLQTWSWRSGCRRSTVTKPSQNDATQSQDARGWKRQMSLSDNRRPYWTWTLAKHELNPGSPHETQATMG